MMALLAFLLLPERMEPVTFPSHEMQETKDELVGSLIVFPVLK
jgi:hypothetical protein